MNLDKLLEHYEEKDEYDLPILNYKEWLKPFGELISKINKNYENFNYKKIGKILLIVEVIGMTPDEKEDYESYYEILRVFINLYDKNKDKTPKEIYQIALKEKMRY